MEWDPLILTAIPGIAAFIGVVYQAWANRRVQEAKAADLSVSAATKMIEQLQEENSTYRARVRDHELRIRRLEKQVRDLGGIPVNGN